MDTYALQMLGIAFVTAVFCVITLAITVKKGQL